jgi:hypothetical protein
MDQALPPALPSVNAWVGSPPQNGNLLRQQENPDRLCMRNTLRALDFLASLHLTIFERPASLNFSTVS